MSHDPLPKMTRRVMRKILAELSAVQYEEARRLLAADAPVVTVVECTGLTKRQVLAVALRERRVASDLNRSRL